MSENTVVHMGENSPEYVAYRLMMNVLDLEYREGAPRRTRSDFLNTYAECLYAVRGFRKFTRE